MLTVKVSSPFETIYERTVSDDAIPNLSVIVTALRILYPQSDYSVIIMHDC